MIYLGISRKKITWKRAWKVCLIGTFILRFIIHKGLLYLIYQQHLILNTLLQWTRRLMLGVSLTWRTVSEGLRYILVLSFFFDKLSFCSVFQASLLCLLLPFKYIYFFTQKGISTQQFFTIRSWNFLCYVYMCNIYMCKIYLCNTCVIYTCVIPV